MWVRGLKPKLQGLWNPESAVAPYVGAWIETCEGLQTELELVVAPYVGAWIETISNWDGSA